MAGRNFLVETFGRAKRFSLVCLAGQGLFKLLLTSTFLMG